MKKLIENASEIFTLVIVIGSLIGGLKLFGKSGLKIDLHGIGKEIENDLRHLSK